MAKSMDNTLRPTNPKDRGQGSTPSMQTPLSTPRADREAAAADRARKEAEGKAARINRIVDGAGGLLMGIQGYKPKAGGGYE